MRNGGYSVTVRHDHYKQGGAAGVMRHAIRSVEEEHGIFREHSNENIDAQRTSENVVLVNDGQGGFKKADSPQEAMQHRKSRLALRADKRKLRSNQNTHMETLLQLDSEFAGSSEEFLSDAKGTADETRRLLQVLTDHVVDKVGQENVNYIALHVDETSPHVQIGWTPLAEDGSLDFRKILGEVKLWKKDNRMRGTLTKTMMSEQHKEVRALLNEHGYPAVEVFSTPQHEEHAPYKRQQQQLDTKLAEREYEVKQREDEADLRERRITRRENKYSTNKQQLDNDRATLDNERAAFETQKQEQQSAHEAEQQRLNEVARQQRKDFEKREKALKDKKAADQQQIKNERESMLSEVNNERESMLSEVENERDTKLSEVQEREDSLGQREQAVSERENEQKRLRKVVSSFMKSRYYQNALKHPMDVSREQAAFVKEVGELYQDIRPTGLEPTHNTPSDRARSRSEATTTRAKPRTPTKRAKRPKPDILREIEEAREKKRKEQLQGQSEGDAPDV